MCVNKKLTETINYFFIFAHFDPQDPRHLRASLPRSPNAPDLIPLNSAKPLLSRSSSVCKMTTSKRVALALFHCCLILEGIASAEKQFGDCTKCGIEEILPYFQKDHHLQMTTSKSTGLSLFHYSFSLIVSTEASW